MGRRRAVIVSVILGASLLLATTASAGTVAESKTTDGNRTLLQRFILMGKAVDYNLVVDDPDGLYPFCVTVQLEKRSKDGWRALGRRNGGLRHECIETPEDGARNLTSTHVGWDTFIYPTRQLSKRFKSGRLRVHGFTDLGGDLTYRR